MKQRGILMGNLLFFGYGQFAVCGKRTAKTASRVPPFADCGLAAKGRSKDAGQSRREYAHSKQEAERENKYTFTGFINGYPSIPTYKAHL
jgi:hypothetical protein